MPFTRGILLIINKIVIIRIYNKASAYSRLFHKNKLTATLESKILITTPKLLIYEN